MVVRIRLAMKGVRNHKFFHLVVINSTKRRDADPLELLGIYHPRTDEAHPTKAVQWSVDRIRYWLRNGAQPSKSAVRLLTLGQLLPPDSPFHPKASPGSPPPAGPPIPADAAATKLVRDPLPHMGQKRSRAAKAAAAGPSPRTLAPALQAARALPETPRADSVGAPA